METNLRTNPLFKEWLKNLRPGTRKYYFNNVYQGLPLAGREESFRKVIGQLSTDPHVPLARLGPRQLQLHTQCIRRGSVAESTSSADDREFWGEFANESDTGDFESEERALQEAMLLSEMTGDGEKALTDAEQINTRPTQDMYNIEQEQQLPALLTKNEATTSQDNPTIHRTMSEQINNIEITDLVLPKCLKQSKNNVLSNDKDHITVKLKLCEPSSDNTSEPPLCKGREIITADVEPSSNSILAPENSTGKYEINHKLTNPVHKSRFGNDAHLSSQCHNIEERQAKIIEQGNQMAIRYWWFNYKRLLSVPSDDRPSSYRNVNEENITLKKETPRERTTSEQEVILKSLLEDQEKLQKELIEVAVSNEKIEDVEVKALMDQNNDVINNLQLESIPLPPKSPTVAVLPPLPSYPYPKSPPPPALPPPALPPPARTPPDLPPPALPPPALTPPDLPPPALSTPFLSKLDVALEKLGDSTGQSSVIEESTTFCKDLVSINTPSSSNDNDKNDSNEVITNKKQYPLPHLLSTTVEDLKMPPPLSNLQRHLLLPCNKYTDNEPGASSSEKSLMKKYPFSLEKNSLLTKTDKTLTKLTLKSTSACLIKKNYILLQKYSVKDNPTNVKRIKQHIFKKYRIIARKSKMYIITKKTLISKFSKEGLVNKDPYSMENILKEHVTHTSLSNLQPGKIPSGCLETGLGVKSYEVIKPILNADLEIKSEALKSEIDCDYWDEIGPTSEVHITDIQYTTECLLNSVDITVPSTGNSPVDADERPTQLRSHQNSYKISGKQINPTKEQFVDTSIPDNPIEYRIIDNDEDIEIDFTPLNKDTYCIKETVSKNTSIEDKSLLQDLDLSDDSKSEGIDDVEFVRPRIKNGFGIPFTKPYSMVENKKDIHMENDSIETSPNELTRNEEQLQSRSPPNKSKLNMNICNKQTRKKIRETVENSPAQSKPDAKLLKSIQKIREKYKSKTEHKNKNALISSEYMPECSTIMNYGNKVQAQSKVKENEDISKYKSMTEHKNKNASISSEYVPECSTIMNYGNKVQAQSKVKEKEDLSTNQSSNIKEKLRNEMDMIYPLQQKAQRKSSSKQIANGKSSKCLHKPSDIHLRISDIARANNNTYNEVLDPILQDISKNPVSFKPTTTYDYSKKFSVDELVPLTLDCDNKTIVKEITHHSKEGPNNVLCHKQVVENNVANNFNDNIRQDNIRTKVQPMTRDVIKDTYNRQQENKVNNSSHSKIGHDLSKKEINILNAQDKRKRKSENAEMDAKTEQNVKKSRTINLEIIKSSPLTFKDNLISSDLKPEQNIKKTKSNNSERRQSSPLTSKDNIISSDLKPEENIKKLKPNLEKKTSPLASKNIIISSGLNLEQNIRKSKQNIGIKSPLSLKDDIISSNDKQMAKTNQPECNKVKQRRLSTNPSKDKFSKQKRASRKSESILDQAVKNTSYNYIHKPLPSMPLLPVESTVEPMTVAHKIINVSIPLNKIDWRTIQEKMKTDSMVKCSKESSVSIDKNINNGKQLNTSNNARPCKTKHIDYNQNASKSKENDRKVVNQNTKLKPPPLLQNVLYEIKKVKIPATRTAGETFETISLYSDVNQNDIVLSPSSEVAKPESYQMKHGSSVVQNMKYIDAHALDTQISVGDPASHFSETPNPLLSTFGNRSDNTVNSCNHQKVKETEKIKETIRVKPNSVLLTASNVQNVQHRRSSTNWYLSPQKSPSTMDEVEHETTASTSNTSYLLEELHNDHANTFRKQFTQSMKTGVEEFVKMCEIIFCIETDYKQLKDVENRSTKLLSPELIKTELKRAKNDFNIQLHEREKAFREVFDRFRTHFSAVFNRHALHVGIYSKLSDNVSLMCKDKNELKDILIKKLKEWLMNEESMSFFCKNASDFENDVEAVRNILAPIPQKEVMSSQETLRKSKHDSEELIRANINMNKHNQSVTDDRNYNSLEVLGNNQLSENVDHISNQIIGSNITSDQARPATKDANAMKQNDQLKTGIDTINHNNLRVAPSGPLNIWQTTNNINSAHAPNMPQLLPNYPQPERVHLNQQGLTPLCSVAQPDAWAPSDLAKNINFTDHNAALGAKIPQKANKNAPSISPKRILRQTSSPAKICNQNRNEIPEPYYNMDKQRQYPLLAAIQPKINQNQPTSPTQNHYLHPQKSYQAMMSSQQISLDNSNNTIVHQNVVTRQPPVESSSNICKTAMDKYYTMRQVLTNEHAGRLSTGHNAKRNSLMPSMEASNPEPQVNYSGPTQRMALQQERRLSADFNAPRKTSNPEPEINYSVPNQRMAPQHSLQERRLSTALNPSQNNTNPEPEINYLGPTQRMALQQERRLSADFNPPRKTLNPEPEINYSVSNQRMVPQHSLQERRLSTALNPSQNNTNPEPEINYLGHTQRIAPQQLLQDMTLSIDFSQTQNNIMYHASGDTLLTCVSPYTLANQDTQVRRQNSNEHMPTGNTALTYSLSTPNDKSWGNTYQLPAQQCQITNFQDNSSVFGSQANQGHQYTSQDINGYTKSQYETVTKYIINNSKQVVPLISREAEMIDANSVNPTMVDFSGVGQLNSNTQQENQTMRHASRHSWYVLNPVESNTSDIVLPFTQDSSTNMFQGNDKDKEIVSATRNIVQTKKRLENSTIAHYKIANSSSITKQELLTFLSQFQDQIACNGLPNGKDTTFIGTFNFNGKVFSPTDIDYLTKRILYTKEELEQSQSEQMPAWIANLLKNGECRKYVYTNLKNQVLQNIDQGTEIVNALSIYAKSDPCAHSIFKELVETISNRRRPAVTTIIID